MDLPFMEKKPTVKPTSTPGEISIPPTLPSTGASAPSGADAAWALAMCEEMDGLTHDIEAPHELNDAVEQLALKYSFEELMLAVGRRWRRAHGPGARAVGPALGIVRGRLGK